MRPQSGPSPDRLKIDDDWANAVKKALAKPVPPEGVPDPDPRYKPRKPPKHPKPKK